MKKDTTRRRTAWRRRWSRWRRLAPDRTAGKHGRSRAGTDELLSWMLHSNWLREKIKERVRRFLTARGKEENRKGAARCFAVVENDLNMTAGGGAPGSDSGGLAAQNGGERGGKQRGGLGLYKGRVRVAGCARMEEIAARRLGRKNRPGRLQTADVIADVTCGSTGQRRQDRKSVV